jgi:hypothetical protein
MLPAVIGSVPVVTWAVSSGLPAGAGRVRGVQLRPPSWVADVEAFAVWVMNPSVGDVNRIAAAAGIAAGPATLAQLRPPSVVASRVDVAEFGVAAVPMASHPRRASMKLSCSDSETPGARVPVSGRCTVDHAEVGVVLP